MCRTRSTCGPFSMSLPTLVSFFPSPSVNRPFSRACASAWSVADRISPSNIAEPLGFASTSRANERPVGPAGALRLELVAERDRREVPRLAPALELQARGRADPLRVRDDAVAEPELGVAVHFLATGLVRLVLGEKARRAQSHRQSQRRPDAPRHHALPSRRDETSPAGFPSKEHTAAGFVTEPTFCGAG